MQGKISVDGLETQPWMKVYKEHPKSIKPESPNVVSDSGCEHKNWDKGEDNLQYML